MNLANMLQEQSIVINSQAVSRDDILHHVAQLAAVHPHLQSSSADQLYHLFSQREELGSTALANRIAIPHCRLKGITDFVVGVVIAPQGVAYGAIDDQPTHVFVYIIAPLEARNEHLRLLSAFSRYLRQPENVNKLLLAKTPREVRDSFLRHTRLGETMELNGDMILFTVIIQEESRFEEILDIFTEVEDANIAVMEASQASAFLYRMPLFAGFWKGDPSGFCRIIQCVVPQTSAQECALQLKAIVDDHAQSGLCFYTQSVRHFYGKLDV
jgi:PTS system nitrogen regulatory IIA component